LMHMVDDATGTVLCQFSAGETTWAAAHLLRAWIERYGVPRALYTDWKNVYVRLPNVQERLRGEAAVTQFGQMCAKLGIRIIAARRRLRAECGCGRTSQDTSSFTIADRACRFAKFPWLLLRRGAEEGALPLPLQPHPRNLRLRQAGLIALLPAIILGDKAGRI